MTRDNQDESAVEVLAFSSDQVCRLRDLSPRQVRYWDETRFFSPEYAPGYARAAYSRVYSFRDVVGLSAIGLLRGLRRTRLSARPQRSAARWSGTPAGTVLSGEAVPRCERC